MRLADIRKQALIKKKKKVGVFNPTTEDFVATFDGKDYTVPKGEMVKFKHHIAHHVAKHLANQILMEKGHSFTKEPERSNLLEELII